MRCGHSRPNPRQTLFTQIHKKKNRGKKHKNLEARRQIKILIDAYNLKNICIYLLIIFVVKVYTNGLLKQTFCVGIVFVVS